MKYLGWIAAAILIGGGGWSCGSDPSPPTDSGSGMDAAFDSGSGMDAAGDSGSACGDGVLGGVEACDGTAFRDDPTCTSLGLPAGTLSCTAECEVDTSSCAVCDDGICSDGETSATCVQDCGVKSIAAGRTHSCAVLADGSLWCWGAWDGHRMGGAPDTNVPIRVPGHDDVVQVTAGDHHTCFTTTADEVWCFGANGFGESGPTPSHDVFPPAMVTAGVRVSAGSNHTCAIEPVANDVVCWGRGDYGQRGDGQFSTRQNAPGVVVPDAQTSAARDVQLGRHVSCLVLDADFVRCWGDNTHGWIDRDRDWKNAPYTIFALPNARATSVAVGDSHVCFNFQRSDGTNKGMVCAGGNAHGQVGTEPSTDVVASAGFDGERRPLVAGFSYSCAQDLSVPESPNLQCWGDNYFGQLGDGSFDAHYPPGEVVGIDEVAALSGGTDHVCAILPDETARCWGRNREGQLGNASPERAHATPVVPVGLGGTP